MALIQADLLNGASLPDLVKTTLGRFDRLDMLINNASSFFPTPIGEITEKAWDDLVGTNLKAPLFLSQAAAPELRKRHGCIVNIIDIHAEFPMKNYVVYTVAKGGLLALTRSLARELGPEVRVNGVAPGTDPVARRRRVGRRVVAPAHRQSDARSSASASPTTSPRRSISWSSAAPYVTGQVIAVDGGRSITL